VVFNFQKIVVKALESFPVSEFFLAAKNGSCFTFRLHFFSIQKSIYKKNLIAMMV